MEYRFRLAAKAVADAEEAHAWIARHSVQGAAKWYVELFDAIDSLKTFPARCSLAPESEAVDVEVRQLLYGKRRNVYRVLFTVQGDVVHILRIRHSARQFLTPDELFPE